MSATPIPRELARLAAGREVEGVLQRIGAHSFDLVAVDADGEWARAVFPSREAAAAAAAALGIPTHDGWPDDLARRVSDRDVWASTGGRRRAL